MVDLGDQLLGGGLSAASSLDLRVPQHLAGAEPLARSHRLLDRHLHRQQHRAVDPDRLTTSKAVQPLADGQQPTLVPVLQVDDQRVGAVEQRHRVQREGDPGRALQRRQRRASTSVSAE